MARKEINNHFYEDLKEDWLLRNDHPIALLRAENRVRNPWIVKTISDFFSESAKVLDVGCGGGLLCKDLVAAGFDVTGLDISESSLTIAKEHAGGGQYEKGNASALPYPDASFDVVCAMDLLEHVSDPRAVIRESGRILKPGGLFFFHTFNRTLLSYLLVIKGVDWVIPNAIQSMHLWPLFIKPRELKSYLEEADMVCIRMKGLKPKVLSHELLQCLIYKRLSDQFPFRFCRSLRTGYCGYARKKTALEHL